MLLVVLIQMTSVKSARLSGPVRPQPLSRTPPIGAWISSFTVGELTFTIPCKGRLHRVGRVAVLNIVAGHHLGRNERVRGVAIDPRLVGEHGRESIRTVRLPGFEEHDTTGPIVTQAGCQHRARSAASYDQNIRALVSAHEQPPFTCYDVHLLACVRGRPRPCLPSCLTQHVTLVGG